MLSDEEKKAIKGLEWSQQQMRLGNLPDYDQGHYADIRIILNLIEKQSKEIKELKNGQIDFWISDKEIEERIRNKFVSKDKIKAKIEELEEKLEYETNNWESEYEYCKEVLQSLLEKE